MLKWLKNLKHHNSCWEFIN